MPDPENLYGEEQESDSGAAPQPSGEDDHNGQTAILPSELCPGMKVGDEIKLRIVRADEDSYEVAYEPEGKAPGNEKAPAPEEGSMASMME